ncbi:bifunctional UDP-N-acetylmuramoyl-tripeptide:D-alanyl-D-alanine ligase/alanine racemase [Pedobacter psychrophilus]|uniref:Alanine racemase n=1 Tax=Pedobacter psychrophilus TaxID=1826909 RepID=A0A179DBP6_9SPHI|nr:bifunctional UDP-N-acetylmuramoyl-tripeptide:D-alanyl-D-alanine ligase/alanine racemase [Pedobacter psychrophilus]OAQ38202.1 bifunctional UDP-N-acetylmuramoyl-tripeptide:D-alanyl-D-alanine ligase/alanine racemase [Pedobacter psychrophilus]
MKELSYSIQNISEIIGDQDLLRHPHQNIKNLLTDSRKITDASSSIFFTLEGKRDAHQFIDSLYKLGVKSFVITQKDFNTSNFPDANFIWVGNALKAMQKLAKAHRKHFDYPVIGITGSNGKTIVKEWLYQLMVNDQEIIRSPKSYNSQMGVSLSVWQMSNQYNLGIFEAGISTNNEMAVLEEIIQPTIGILTNIGDAHDEGFNSREEKINEKLKLFKNSQIVIINKKYIGESQDFKKNFTWSLTENADLQILDINKKENQTLIKGTCQEKEIEINIPFTSQSSIENAIICWATLLYLGYQQNIIENRMMNLLPVKMRLELKKGINQSDVIDDSYNSDFSSLDIALNFLNQQNQHPTKTLILSDIYQSGIAESELYKNVAHLIKNKGVDKFIGIGKELKKHQSFFKKDSLFFSDTEYFLKRFNWESIYNETILIKGARHFEFERISKKLSLKIHETVLEINLNAIVSNLNHYKGKLKKGVKLMAMVKAFAYGSGSEEIANLLQHNGVDYLSVAYADEGIELREAGITIPIMVLGPEVSSFEAIINYNLEPEIYSLRILKAFADLVSSKNLSKQAIHIKLDTGMHRLGFMEDEVDELLSFLKQNNNVKVKSMFSHLAGSESEKHHNYTQQQIDLFSKITSKFERELGYIFLKHISNTSAITKWPKAQFDMVRLGIGLYGIEGVIEEQHLLANVATLKTTISQIKHLKKGDTVGYGRSGVMLKDGKIATVKIGYADGFPRILGNGKGEMLINNQKVKTIGNICMDMTMLDVSDLEVNTGDDVIVFGEDLSVYDLAKNMETIPYEVITNISQRVKRIYYYE